MYLREIQTGNFVLHMRSACCFKNINIVNRNITSSELEQVEVRLRIGHTLVKNEWMGLAEKSAEVNSLAREDL